MPLHYRGTGVLATGKKSSDGKNWKACRSVTWDGNSNSISGVTWLFPGTELGFPSVTGQHCENLWLRDDIKVMWADNKFLK